MKKKTTIVASDKEKKKKKDCSLKTDLRYPVPELKQLKQTITLLRRVMGFHHEWEFAPAGHL